MKPLLISALLSALAAAPASAHRSFLLPSATVLSGDQWVSVDAARGNDLFHFNHNALSLDGLKITSPDGGELEPLGTTELQYRNVFDVHPQKPGTYRIAVVLDGLRASWNENGAHRRWTGPAAEFEHAVPDAAEALRVFELVSRVETYITVGAPDRGALAPSGRGLELRADTHPNDLYAGETARFGFLLDGEPAAGLAVTVIRGGTRYRDAPEELKLHCDESGRFELRWPEAGMYWISAALRGPSSHSAAAARHSKYEGTFEVLPP